MSGSRTSKLGVQQMTVIALVAVMMLVAKMALRLPIKVSGHGGVLWIAALLVGTAVVRRPGAAALMGLIGGTLVALLQPGDAGMIFTIGKYVVPGVVLEVLAPLLGWRFDSVVPAVFAGAAAHASKVLVDVLQGLAAGVSGAFLMTGITVELLLHIAFGALGGLVAALVLRTLIRAQIPQLAPILDRGDPE